MMDNGYDAPRPAGPPPASYPPPQQPGAAVRHHSRSISMIVFGGLIAVAGIVGLAYISRAYSICNSGLGAFVQASSHAAAVHCQQDTVFHAVSLVAIVAGVLLAMAGVIRIAMERRPG
jgi:hypothetical protein